MAGYMGDMHADATAYHQQGYNPQHAMMNIDSSNVDQAYLNGDGMISAGDYNGYYPPPQAPRLTAAAARASSLAAMYYNPTLHPQHAFNSNVGGVGSWVPPPYRPKNVGDITAPPPAAYQHQYLEHQLMAQNSMTKESNPAYQSGYNAAIPGYGSEQPQQQQLMHYQGRHLSHPSERQQNVHRQWDNKALRHSSAWTWDGPSYGPAGSHQHISNATPTTYNPHHGQSYFHHTNQQYQDTSSEASSLPLSQAQSQFQPSQPGQGQGGGWNSGAQGEIWNAHGSHGVDWRAIHRPEGYHGNWQHGPAWNQPQANSSTWNQVGPIDDPSSTTQWGGYPHPSFAPHNNSVTAPATVYQPQADAYKQAHTSGSGIGPLDVGGIKPDLGVEGAKLVERQSAPAAEKTNSGPAPPSPATLDKSSVPISSVGAEIIWSTCAALLDPEVLTSLLSSSNYVEGRKSRCRISTSSSTPSSSALDTPFTPHSDWPQSPVHSSLAQQSNHRTTCKMQPLQRLAFGNGGGGDAAASSEESSASSSEPGTPPSSFPSYLYDDLHRSGSGRRENVKSLGTVQGIRGLGLSSPSEPTFNPRDFSLSKTSQQGVNESASNVLNLISPSWKWSINDDKLESLNSSLRDGAKVDSCQSQKVHTYSAMKRTSSTQINGPKSPHSPEQQFPTGYAAPGSEASPAFRRFAHQVLAQTLVSPTAFMLAMMYSIRVPFLAIQIDSDGKSHLDPEATEIFAQPPSAAPFKLFTLGLMIANKHLDDNTFLNKTWNEVTGISLSELNRMERWYLEKCSYEITVPEEPWVTFLERLAVRTESKLATHHDAKRYRVSTKHRTSASVPSLPNVATSKASNGGQASNEDALKRLLLSIEEALVVIGRIAPFDLTNASVSRSDDVRRSSFTSEVVVPSDSSNHHHRPNTSLQHLHHHCHSAPTLALHPKNSLDANTDVDVFEDEDGPYRPQVASIRSKVDSNDQHNYRKGNLDHTLSRSISENITTSSWQQQYRANSLVNDSKMTEAPLAPSVLLDLLNRGQHFAHAAH